MPAKTPIDPLQGPPLALAGRVVVMDEALTVIPHGVLYIAKGSIVGLEEASAPPPAGFEGVPVVNTGGTLYPGLIELHNHLPYNVLPLWNVPKKFTNRDQWSGTGDYQKLVSGPMQVVGKTPGLLPAVVRYVEARALLGGVTTSQGVQLFSNAGVRRFFRGIVRNVEQTDEAALPEAATRVADVEARDAKLFLARLLKQSCFLLHLSEGTDATARKHFLALQMSDGEWAISRQLAGIHCAALHPEDFDVLAQHQGAMVWSPMSNLLLYGQTADVKAAKSAGVRIGLGPDWSPSGSKNLLGELKVARLVSQAQGGIFTDAEIIAMATRSAASILQWQDALGTLEAGKRADVLVIAGQKSDPYAGLISASETSISLVMINGVARYGTPSLMQHLSAKSEKILVGGHSRMVYFEQTTADPDVEAISLSEAHERLTQALKTLPDLASELERPRPPAPAARLGPEPLVWSLALDEIQPTGIDLRPRLPLGARGAPTGPQRLMPLAKVPLSELVEPIALSPLTVADDGKFLDQIAAEANLPAFIKSGLKEFH
ncbi:MAG TPA: amidohydrolase family protein [Terriglobia bacterium]|nr:amidohydrolase family protein [Terriglobia bacterium]